MAWTDYVTERIDKRADGHWIWTAGVFTTGQPYVARRDAPTRSARRAVWMLTETSTPPDRLRPTCGEELCVRPAHLVDSTAPRNTCPSGHPYNEDSIVEADGGRRCRVCKNEQDRAYRRHKKEAARLAVTREVGNLCPSKPVRT